MKAVAGRGVVDPIMKWAEEGAGDGREVVGWLVGYWTDEDAVVLDAVLSKNSELSHMTGAQGSPEEESTLSMLLPRGLGIIGLFHSHPFARGRKALFHSKVDDLTLSNRSAGGRYLSVVTDGGRLACYLFDKGERMGEIAVSVSDVQVGLPFRTGVYRVSDSAVIGSLDSIGTAMKRLWEIGDVSPADGAGSTRGRLSIERRRDGFLVDVEATIRPMVFGDGGPELLRLEAEDLVDLLVWKQSHIYNIDTGDLGSVTVDLGRINYSGRPIPYKRLNPPKRRFIYRRRARDQKD